MHVRWVVVAVSGLCHASADLRPGMALFPLTTTGFGNYKKKVTIDYSIIGDNPLNWFSSSCTK